MGGQTIEPLEALDKAIVKGVEVNEPDLVLPSERAGEITRARPQVYDAWLLEKRVRMRNDWGEEEVGDSCCFGTRTVDTSMGCIWKKHGGV